MATLKKEVKEHIYVWGAKDKKGKILSGEMRASSESLVRVSLRAKGYHDISVKKRRFNKGKPVVPADIAVLTRQLATMMKAGVPLLQTLELVANGHPKQSVTRLLYDIKTTVETGSSLSEAFARHPQHFGELYCSLVAAGEQAGILDAILNKLAQYQESMEAIKKKIKKAMFYPIAVLALAFLVTAVIMIFVIPSFKEVFEGFGAQLPTPTLIVIGISDFFVANWFFMLMFVVALGWGFKRLLRTNEKVRHAYERITLKLPIFGPIINKAIVARWNRTLATMFAAGVPLVEALDAVAGVSANVVYQTATYNIQRKVTMGQSLTASMLEERLFPNMVIQMAQIGEEAGSLDEMLNKSAEFYEAEVDNAVDSLSSLIEPLIIVVLGVIVGGLVVAMYLPIFKMAAAV